MCARCGDPPDSRRPVVGSLSRGGASSPRPQTRGAAQMASLTLYPPVSRRHRRRHEYSRRRSGYAATAGAAEKDQLPCPRGLTGAAALLGESCMPPVSQDPCNTRQGGPLLVDALVTGAELVEFDVIQTCPLARITRSLHRVPPPPESHAAEPSRRPARTRAARSAIRCRPHRSPCTYRAQGTQKRATARRISSSADRS